jgi:AbiU2
MSANEENVRRMADFLTNVERDITQLDKNLNNIKDFLVFAETEDYRNDSIAQKISMYVQYVSISEIILTLDRLFEPHSDGRDSAPIECDTCGNMVKPKTGKKVFGQRSFIWYLEQLKEHSTSFNPPHKFTNEELDEQLTRIQNEADNLKIIGKYRDKWFAHRDKTYFDNPMKLWDGEPLELKVLESTVGLAKNIVEEHFSRFRDIGKVWNDHLSELRDIIFIRQKMLEYSKNNKELYVELRNCQDGK